MKKRIVTSIIILLLVLLIVCALLSSTYIVASYANDYYTEEELNNLIEESKSIKENAHTMAKCARNLGWKEDSALIKELQLKWKNADEAENKYNNLLKEKQETIKKAEEIKWGLRASEYPVAT